MRRSSTTLAEILQANNRAVAELTASRLEGPVRFGTVQDLADTVLPRALAQFAKAYPGVDLHVQVGTSTLLLDEADAGELDFAICFQSRRAPRAISREPLVWLGHRALASAIRCRSRSCSRPARCASPEPRRSSK